MDLLEADIVTRAATPLAEVPAPLPLLKSELGRLTANVNALLDMESALEDFLARYYARILPLSHRLEALRSGADNVKFAMPSPPKAPYPLEDRLKSLYRQLMKTYHPDRARSGAKYDAGTIIRAYEEKDIARLWLLQLEHEWRIRPNAALLTDFLHAQHREIMEANEILAKRRAVLEASDEWRLKERVQEAWQRGVDLVTAIASEFEAQLADYY